MGKAKRGANKTTKASGGIRQVSLTRRSILEDHCTMLVPSNITNSGRSDGGWMDREGITQAGLGYIFHHPSALNPIDCFYSNDAYARPGFCTMHLELHPPLEAIGDPSTVESLLEYMEQYIEYTENDYYKSGDYRNIEDLPRIIEDPSSIGSSASLIVQKGFEVLITPGPNLPRGLTATTIVSLVHFKGKGNVLFKANNFERHSPPLDRQTILASITYATTAPPYLGADPSLSGWRAMNRLFETGGNIGKARATMARAQAAVGTVPKYCLECGNAGAHRDGQQEQDSSAALFKCSKCLVATYCSRSCQKADWKRHKRTECEI